MTKIDILLAGVRPRCRKNQDARPEQVTAVDTPCPPGPAGQANGRHRGSAASERMPDFKLPGRGRHRRRTVHDT
jgi:hypothetical protein